jgi:hypothetical protein
MNEEDLERRAHDERLATVRVAQTEAEETGDRQLAEAWASLAASLEDIWRRRWTAA